MTRIALGPQPNRRRLSVLLTLVIAGALVLGPFAKVQFPFSTDLGADKLRHILTFGLLVLPTAIFWRRALPAMIVFLLFTGAGLEVLQPLFGREGDVYDMLANLVGVGIGVLIGLPIGWALLRHQRTKPVSLTSSR